MFKVLVGGAATDWLGKKGVARNVIFATGSTRPGSEYGPKMEAAFANLLAEYPDLQSQTPRCVGDSTTVCEITP